MLPGFEMMHCDDLAVPATVMAHVVQVESSYNPYAIGVVGGRLARQPLNLAEALATVRMLESRGYNFSVGLAQVNRHNLGPQGLKSYAHAFDSCPNVQAGARILADCYDRANGNWGKAFSCYYSGNFTTGFRHGYVQKVYASMRDDAKSRPAPTRPAIAAAAPPIRDAASQPAPTPGSLRLAKRKVPASPIAPAAAAAAGVLPASDASGSDAPVTVDAPVMLQPASDPRPQPAARFGDRAFVF